MPGSSVFCYELLWERVIMETIQDRWTQTLMVEIVELLITILREIPNKTFDDVEINQTNYT